MSGAWASFAGLVLRILAALGLYRAGGKAAEARQDKDTLEKIEDIRDARSNNAAATDAELRDKLLRSRTKR